MIKVVCFSNEDGFVKETWPTQMVCAPRHGDRVYSASGLCLRIVGLGHKRVFTEQGDEVPLLEVELGSHWYHSS